MVSNSPVIVSSPVAALTTAVRLQEDAPQIVEINLFYFLYVRVMYANNIRDQFEFYTFHSRSSFVFVKSRYH